MRATRLAGAALGLIALFVAGSCHALDPDRRLTQLHHTAWTLEAGAPPDIWALAQGADGFLWLGTGEGLYRFDGLRFEAVHPGGDPLASRNITSLLAARDGSLWIGSYAGEVSHMRDGRLQAFVAPAKGSVQQLAETQDGTVWAALGSTPDGGLARFHGQGWLRLGAAQGVPEGGFYSVLAARDGAVWAASELQVLVMRPGEQQFHPVPGSRPMARLAQSPDGRIWYSGERHADGAEPVGGQLALTPLPPGADAAITDRSLFDRNGALWESAKDGGVVRITSPGTGVARTERFTAAQGLTSDVAVPVLEDREGDVWVGTNLGLDRFRAASAVVAVDLPNTVRGGFQAAAAPGGGMFVSAGRTLRRLQGDGPGVAVARLPAIPTLLQPHADVLMIGLLDGSLLNFGPQGLQPAPGPPAGNAAITSWTCDASNTQWVTASGSGVFFGAGTTWTHYDAGGQRELAATLRTVSGPGGGTWFYAGSGVYKRSGNRLTPFGSAQGLAVGTVNILSIAGDDVLVGGDDGIARFSGGRFQTISSDRAPALSRVTGIARAAGAVWVNGMKGVMRIPEADLSAAFAVSPQTGHDPEKLHFDLLDVTDGLPGVAQQDHGTPTAIASDGGRVWLVQSHGVAYLDPARLVRNDAPPPVVIRNVASQGRAYAFPHVVTLEAGATAVQIDYAALSLSKPEQVAFRYRLVGLEDEWVEAGPRRQAFYTRLAPGRYVFRVIARNSDGVWNMQGAAVPIVIPPTFMQSTPFALLCSLCAASVVWLAWSLRMRVAAQRLRDRFAARLAERERIARELHDTLLQGFGGLMLRFQAAAAGIAPEHASRRQLDAAMALADTVLREGRLRLVDLRETRPPRDVPQSLAEAAERLSLTPQTKLRVTVEGEARALHPIVADEIVRIGEEAIANVKRHAAAERLDASIAYCAGELRVCFWDDGVGISPDVLKRGGRSGHYGLRGMHERAGRIRGHLTVRSAPEFGTAIELSVPGSVAYAPASPQGLDSEH